VSLEARPRVVPGAELLKFFEGLSGSDNVIANKMMIVAGFLSP
jgi:hypothetical protein